MQSSLYIIGVFAAFLAIFGGAGQTADAAEPRLHVKSNACPFEGCRFGKWSVRKATILYDHARGSTPVGTARAGEWVNGVTGTLYVPEIRVEVVHAIELEGDDPYVTESWNVVGKLRVGDVFYILGEQGEGFSEIYLRGQTESLDLFPLLERGDGAALYFKSCDQPSSKCWWQIPENNRVQKREWWVKIRLPDGTVGWTREIGSFGNIDCIGAEIDPCG